jgi:FecR protein
VIVIKDFRSAASLRELFEIMLGSVRVKINHFGGRPNPYRINSPTASIAVRGTDFSVTVDSRGDTQVMVYEGAVEVTSLIDPTQSVVIEAGRGVLLVPGQGFQLFNVLSGRELAENQGNGRGQGTSATGQMDDRDWDSPRNIASIYEQYIAGLSEIGQLPFLQRYSAFPEAHLDSLENPAYAANFRTAEGRIVLLPSLNGTGGLDENPTPPGLSAVSPLNYSAASQVSMFVPLAGFVIGGTATGSKVGSGVQGAPSDLGLSSILSQTVPEGSLQTSASSTGEFFSSSFLVARRFGGTSFGLAIENLQGAGSLAAQILSTEPLSGSIERIDSTSAISQRRFTAGFERDLPHNQAFGFYYRYGLIEASENDTSHVLNNFSEPLDATRSSGHSSEFGLRMRGPLGRRFLYGVEASWIGLSLSDGLTRAITIASHQRDRAQRSSAALGLGYFLDPRTVLSFDIAGGTSPAATSRTEISTGDLVQTGLQNSRFISTNVGIQRKVSSNLFLNASLLGIWQAYTLSQAAYPDSTGNALLITDPFLPMTATGYRPPRVSSDFGAGWRFSNRLLVQYVFSTSYGVDSGTHTLMLRYTFHLGGE